LAGRLAFLIDMGNNGQVSGFDELRDRIGHIGHIGDMPYQHAAELVTEHLEEALAPRARRRFYRHVRGCPACTI